jgi:prepilin-type N-terminal cleavage/methylation domain-containing protein
MRGKKGFTLIEVLIVVIILGILATISIPQFGKLVERARMSEAATNVAAIRTAQRVYYLEESAISTDTSLAELGDIVSGITWNAWTLTSITDDGNGEFTITLTRNDGPESGETLIYDSTTNTWTDDGTYPYKPS